jgi:hypothetical protein
MDVERERERDREWGERGERERVRERERERERDREEREMMDLMGTFESRLEEEAWGEGAGDLREGRFAGEGERRRATGGGGDTEARER